MKTRYAPFGRGGGVFWPTDCCSQTKIPNASYHPHQLRDLSMNGTRVKLLYILQPWLVI